MVAISAGGSSNMRDVARAKLSLERLSHYFSRHLTSHLFLWYTAPKAAGALWAPAGERITARCLHTAQTGCSGGPGVTDSSQ